MGRKKTVSPATAYLQDLFGPYGGESDPDDELDNQAESGDESDPSDGLYTQAESEDELDPDELDNQAGSENELDPDDEPENQIRLTGDQAEDELDPDDERDNQAGPENELNPDDELENQIRLVGNQVEDDTLFTTYPGGNSLLPDTFPPLPGPSNPPLTTNSQVYWPNSKTHEQLPDPNAAILGPELEDEIFSNSRDRNYTGDSNNQPVERHTHDRSCPGEQQARPPGHRNSPRSQSKSWKYKRIRYGVTETLFEYKYDEDGRLSAEGGYESNIIQYYLANHDLYTGCDIKDCGLTLWIQRAPRTADYRGGAAGRRCLYKECSVSKDRSIKPGDVRVAFDDSYARTPEHDPQANAAYVHLECLEKRMPEDLREMYARLNFKVEERGPHPDDPLLRNPTIFSTMQEILYAVEYLEQCRQEFKEDSNHRPTRKTSYSGPLSAGIEKQYKSQYEAVRDLQRKVLELGGSQAWYQMNTILEEQYIQAGGPAPTVNPRISPQTTGTRPDPTRRQPQGAESNQNDFDAERPQPGTHQEDNPNDDTIPEDPYAAVQSDSSVRGVSQDRPTSIKPLPSKPKKSKKKGKGKKIEPPYMGRGKIKQRMFINDSGLEVWEEFEDPFSNPESDHEPNRRTRKPRNDNEQRKESSAGAQDVGRKKEKRPPADLNDGGEDEDEDDEGDRRGTKRRRGEESQGQKPKRVRSRRR
ncbi:hypothetical protein MMC31_003388 [Peltigera leucophlebia]|nr:hypothetical protein [Peltigera leucophlebia]